MKFRGKGVSQVVSSLMIVFLMLISLTTYIVFLTKSYSLASKAVERTQKETLRSMENIVVKTNPLNDEYILAYEGLRPNIEYVLVKCGDKVLLGKPEEYGLKLGEPIPKILLEKIEDGCEVLLVTERGKVYNVGLKVSQMLTVSKELSKLNAINITSVNEVVNSVSKITSFLENSSITVGSGKIYVVGSKGDVLYALDIAGNIPMYDVVTQETHGVPVGEYLGVFHGSLSSLGDGKVVFMKTTPTSLTVLKIPVCGNTPDGNVKLGKGVYMVYLTGEAYDGYYYRRVYGEGVRVYISIYRGSSRIAYKVLDGADRLEYYFRGLKLREWSGQFDGVFALAVLEGEVTLKYSFSSEPTTWYMHHTFVVEKIANIGGNGRLKIVKHGGRFYLEYGGHLFSLVASSGTVEGELYELGSYIIAPVGYVVNGVVSEGKPIPASPGIVKLVYFKPLTLKPAFDPMVLGVERRHVYVRFGNSYSIFRQTWGNLFDQRDGLSLRIYYRSYDALGNIITYTTFSAILPENQYMTLNIISDSSTTYGASLKVVFNGKEAFSLPLPTTPRSYLVKLSGNKIEYGQITIALTTSYIRPNNKIKVTANF